MGIYPFLQYKEPSMKNQMIPLFFVMLMLAGCATTKQMELPSDQPELITMTSLPPVARMIPANGLKLNILFHIRGDGSVTKVRMLGSSGDPDWDRSAIDSMRQWRFTANELDRLDAGQWIRNTIILQVQEPTIMTLGELTVGSQPEADSLYFLLQHGSDFDALLRQVAPGASAPIGRFIGSIDIAKYPKHVRDELRKLGRNEITRPLRVGATYVIYKRYKPDGLQDLPQ
jgi:TonB family protein